MGIWQEISISTQEFLSNPSSPKVILLQNPKNRKIARWITRKSQSQGGHSFLFVYHLWLKDGWSPKLTCTWYRSGVRNPRPQQLPPNRPFKNHHFGWPFLQFSRMSGCETCPLNLTRLKNPRLKNPHSQTPKKNSQKQTSLLYQNQIHYTQKKINGWNLKIPLEKGETTSNTSMFVVLGVYFPRCISIASIYLENPAFFRSPKPQHNPLVQKTPPFLRNITSPKELGEETILSSINFWTIQGSP